MTGSPKQEDPSRTKHMTAFYNTRSPAQKSIWAGLLFICKDQLLLACKSLVGVEPDLCEFLCLLEKFSRLVREHLVE